MFKLIIFDFDGVLVLSNDAHVEAAFKAMERAGISTRVSREGLTSHFGKPYRVILKLMMGDDYSKEKLDRAYEYHSEIIRSEWFLENMSPIPGLGEFLEKLREKGIKLAIATGNERSFFDVALDYLGLSDLFDLTLCIEDVENSKPSPDMLLKAMGFFSAGRDETVFVGDAESDVLAAKSAGVKSIAVLSGVLTREGAERLNPDFIVSGIKDIYTIAINR